MKIQCVNCGNTQPEEQKWEACIHCGCPALIATPETIKEKINSAILTTIHYLKNPYLIKWAIDDHIGGFDKWIQTTKLKKVCE